MTIWLLALVLLAFLGYSGYCFGAIRGIFTLVGLLVGAVLAFPLGHAVNPLLGLVGLKNPFLAWLTGAFVVYVLVLVAFKIAGFLVHRRVDVYLKKNENDMRVLRWNRLSERLGMCLGLAIAMVYLVLISLVVYVFSYTTAQVVTPENASWSLKMLNLMGKDVDRSGMVKITAAMDPMPAKYYEVADIAGLIYHNDLLEGRLSRYPAFLMLGQRPEFQAIGNDTSFAELRQSQPSFFEIVNNPEAKAVLQNPDLLREVWAAASPNLRDLETFLRTGKSARYDGEKILGRWTFDLNGVINQIKRTKPNVKPVDMLQLRRVLVASLGKTTLLAAPDNHLILENFGVVTPATTPNAAPTVDYQTLQGQWSSSGGKYEITLPDKPALEGDIQDDELTISGDALPLRFERDM
jgi:hypothetical protein